MCGNLEEIDETRLLALNYLKAYQSRVGNAYNKRIGAKSFNVGDNVKVNIADLLKKPAVRKMISELERTISNIQSC